VLVYCLIKKDPSVSCVERGRGGVLTEGEGGGDGQQPSLGQGRSQAQENTQTGVFLVVGVGDGTRHVKCAHLGMFYMSG